MPVATVPDRPIVKEALLVGVSYATNRVLKRNGYKTQAGAHSDTMNLRQLLISQWTMCSRMLSIALTIHPHSQIWLQRRRYHDTDRLRGRASRIMAH